MDANNDDNAVMVTIFDEVAVVINGGRYGCVFYKQCLIYYLENFSNDFFV